MMTAGTNFAQTTDRVPGRIAVIDWLIGHARQLRRLLVIRPTQAVDVERLIRAERLRADARRRVDNLLR